MSPDYPDDDTAMENLARFIIRASFSQERMQYLNQEGTVIYTSKDGATTRNFPALEWLAAMCSHIPNRGEQMVRYYGHYSNVSRGKRQQEGLDEAIPCILEPHGNVKAFRACPRPERGATPNTPGMPIFTHNITPHQKRRAVEVCLDCAQKQHLTG